MIAALDIMQAQSCGVTAITGKRLISEQTRYRLIMMLVGQNGDANLKSTTHSVPLAWNE